MPCDRFSLPLVRGRRRRRRRRGRSCRPFVQGRSGPGYSQSAQPKITLRVSTSPGTGDRAIAGDRILELAIENEMIDTARLILGIRFKMNGESRRYGRNSGLGRISALGCNGLARRCSQLYVEPGSLDRNSIRARIHDPGGRCPIPSPQTLKSKSWVDAARFIHRL